MPLPPSSCLVCGPHSRVAPSSLLKCSRCQGVLYCGREHQAAEFAEHKAVCRRIKKMHDVMAEEAEKIRNGPEDDMFSPPNAFATDVGHFWGIHSTRPYMRAKNEVIRALSIIPARTAVEAALVEAKDCLRLCRGDNMGVREVVPTLMLLLGQYQEAYDFIKWYATSGNADDYDWGDMDLPFLDVDGADMMEDSPGYISDVFSAAAVVYIKMTLANTVQDAIHAHELADHASLPAVVTDSLGEFLAPSMQTQSVADLKKLHKKLTRQVREAFDLTHSRNKHYWPAMLDPMPLVESADPPYYAPGDANQVKMWVAQNAILWLNHHDFIHEQLRK